MIKAAIYDYFSNQPKREYDEDNIYFGASYITDCKRKIYYKKTNTPVSSPISDHTFIKFELGHITHESIQNIIKEKLNVIECEVEKEFTAKEVKFKYACDLKIELGGKYYIVEIKSIYANGARDIEKNGAREDNILQLYMYMMFEGVSDGILYYICRDTGYQFEFDFNIHDLHKQYGKKIKDKLIDLKMLEIDIVSEKVPERDFNIVMKKLNKEIKNEFTMENKKYKSDWRCSYCQWYDHCWKDVIDRFVESDKQFYINGEII